MRRTTRAALAALLVAGLAGCGSDPKPKFSHSVPPSPSNVASTSPKPSTPGPPRMPAAARSHTVAGAEAFTRFFIASVDYSSKTLDVEELKSLSSPYCDGCHDAISSIERLARKSAHVVGGRWSAKTITVTPLRAGSKRLMQVTALGSSEKETITFPKGNRDVYPGGATKDRLILLPSSTGWTVDSWEVL